MKKSWMRSPFTKSDNKEGDEDISVEELRALYRESVLAQWPELSNEQVNWMVEHIFDEEELTCSRKKRAEAKQKFQKTIRTMAKLNRLDNK